ncbi:MAG TPA: DUF1566 domain-containing protein [Burkholderiaceae bacterium]|nr:DUF1566 domain-containing protein [Burkholderiaceae bacterium]
MTTLTTSHQKRALCITALVATLLVTACGGGSGNGNGEATPEATPSGAPAPTGSTTPLTCDPGLAQTASTGFSEVFKNCVGTLAVYYPLTDCVRDNKTGLIWEGKPATGQRAANKYFTNFDSTVGNQVANTGSNDNPRPATQAEINADYNTIGYINLVNGLGVCGGNWRLPNQDELLGLFVRIDPNWVPNHMSTGGYWSSSVRANITYERTAYLVSYHGRSTTETNRDLAGFVRLVRK